LRRGQLYWIRWEPARGSEQRGRRPGLIIQADPINASRRYGNTIVLALTTAPHPVPTHVLVEPSESNGLARRSSVMCEQCMTISKERLEGLIGDLDAATMEQVNRALKRALALP
jgi:mRNA interferase MazF